MTVKYRTRLTDLLAHTIWARRRRSPGGPHPIFGRSGHAAHRETVPGVSGATADRGGHGADPGPVPQQPAVLPALRHRAQRGGHPAGYDAAAAGSSAGGQVFPGLLPWGPSGGGAGPDRRVSVGGNGLYRPVYGRRPLLRSGYRLPLGGRTAGRTEERRLFPGAAGISEGQPPVHTVLDKNGFQPVEEKPHPYGTMLVAVRNLSFSENPC